MINNFKVQILYFRVT